MFTYQHPNDLLGWILLSLWLNAALLFAILRVGWRAEARHARTADAYLELQAAKREELEMRMKLASNALKQQQSRKPTA